MAHESKRARTDAGRVGAIRLRQNNSDAVDVTLPPAGELFSCRNTTIPVDFTPGKDFSLVHTLDPDQVAATTPPLFSVHNPKVVHMSVSFTPDPPLGVEGLVYCVRIVYAMLPDAHVSLRIAEELTIPYPINPTLSIATEKYRFTNGKDVEIRFDTHYGAKMLVTVATMGMARDPLLGDVLTEICQDEIRVDAPQGLLYIPTPKFTRSFPRASQTDKLTVPEKGEYQVQQFRPTDSIYQHLLPALYGGFAEHARTMCTLYYHDGVPIPMTATVGDLPLIDFVKKLSGRSFPREQMAAMGDDDFHYYNQLLYIERNIPDTVLWLVRTEKREFQAWVRFTNVQLQSNHGMIRALQALFPDAHDLLASAICSPVVGKAQELCIKSNDANPLVYFRMSSMQKVLDEDLKEFDRVHENTHLYDVLSDPGARGGIVVSVGSRTEFVTDNNRTLKGIGITWETSLACRSKLHHPLLSHFKAPYLRDKARINRWNRIWTLPTGLLNGPQFTIRLNYHNIGLAFRSTVNTQTRDIAVRSNFPTSLLRIIVANGEKIAHNKIELSFDGRKIVDGKDRTLKFYGIRAGSEVRVCFI